MSSVDISSELESPEYKVEYENHLYINNSFLQCLSFVYMNCSKNEQLRNQLFFLYMIDDIVQSVVAIKILATEGIRNTCRRELRYLIELAVKACYISQKKVLKSFDQQITEYKKELKSTNISMIDEVNLYFLCDNSRTSFLQEVKRMYGEMCCYVHSTQNQIIERLDMSKKGRTIGLEGTEELYELNIEIGKVYSYVVILLFHSIPQWCVGDYLVEGDGETIATYFSKSKYFAEIDKKFDYKFERQDKLQEINDKRKANIEF